MAELDGEPIGFVQIIDAADEETFIDPLRRNERAIRFYESLGFRHEGIRWFDEDECAVMRYDRDTLR